MDIKKIRLMSAKVEFQAKSDPAFLKRLQEDPVAVLQAEGFDYAVAQELTTQLRGEEAAKLSMCSDCDPYSCIITACCWYTTGEPTNGA